MWISVVIIGIGTFLTRLSFIAFFGERQMPVWMELPLRYVAPGVLGAIVLPAIVRPNGPIEFLPAANPRFLAGLVAVFVAYKWRNVLLVVAAGMGSLWLIDWMF